MDVRVDKIDALPAVTFAATFLLLLFPLMAPAAEVPSAGGIVVSAKTDAKAVSQETMEKI